MSDFQKVDHQQLWW